MVKAYIALGSNLGDRYQLIRRALTCMTETRGIRLRGVSSLQETRPLGGEDQPDYINGVAEIETTMEPLALLDRLQAIEEALGRRRIRRWGPRTMDLDILIYGNKKMRHPRLTIPHPELPNRPFLQQALDELGVRRKSRHG